MEKRYQVFVSSTFEDLKEERKAVIEALLNAKFIPAGMELFAASNDEQFEYIKKIIDTCDYYVLIIAARYGSINPSTGLSFTEQEYDYAVSKGIPVLAFLHSDPYNLPYNKREDDKRKELELFREKARNSKMCRMWNNLTELATWIVTSLNNQVKVNPQKGWVRNDANNLSINDRLMEQVNEENMSLKDEIKRLQTVISKLDTQLKSREGIITALQEKNVELCKQLKETKTEENVLDEKMSELVKEGNEKQFLSDLCADLKTAVEEIRDMDSNN